MTSPAGACHQHVRIFMGCHSARLPSDQSVAASLASLRIDSAGFVPSFPICIPVASFLAGHFSCCLPLYAVPFVNSCLPTSFLYSCLACLAWPSPLALPFRPLPCIARLFTAHTMISSGSSGPPQPSLSAAVMTHTSKRWSKLSTATGCSSHKRTKAEGLSSSGIHLQGSDRVGIREGCRLQGNSA